MKRFILLATFFSAGIFATKQAAAQTTVTLDSTVLNVQTIISGIDIPWEITFGPDDMIWMTERYGRISRVNPSTGSQDVLLDLSSTVNNSSESGLLGLALHPNFPTSPYVYVAYTYGSWSNMQERLVRYEYNGTTLVNPLTIVDNIEGNSTHIGCRIMFLPDGTFIMTTGDAQDLNLPQDITSTSGKVLRFNDDGTIPADNPFPGNPVYTWGHRNPQGLEYHNNMIYCSEHGPTTDDEFHIIEAGRNYGWPDVHGYCDLSGELQFCSDSNVYEPMLAWTPTIATSDIIWYDNPIIPEWENKMLMAVLKDKKIIALELDGAGTNVLSQTHYLTNQFGRIRDITIDQAGCVYIATNGSSWSNTSPFTHSIVRLCPTTVTGIDDHTNGPLVIDVQPNPAVGGIIQVKSEQLLDNAPYELVDLNGRKVLEGVVSGTQFTIGTDEVAGGTYLLNIRTADQVGTVRVQVR